MANIDYRIVDENGDEFISARAVRSVAVLKGAPPKQIADEAARVFNANMKGKFTVECA